MRRFALLDRDGTIIHERHYLADPADVELLPGAARGLRELHRLGFGLVVVTNQSGLARGYFDQTQLERIHARLRHLLSAEGVTLDGIYVCPHLPEAYCICRKPRPGLAQQAVAEHGFDVAEAIVVGDKSCDVDLGRAVGAMSFLVRTGYGLEFESSSGADLVVDDLPAVAAYLGGAALASAA
jgi:D-glycero-D-manno-heptose 1,7-bisphosphate phosphatase